MTPCVSVGDAIVCRPSTLTLRAVRVCPCCKQRRRQVGLFAVWYDTLWTCLGCGDTYCAEEGRLERPFARGWREREKAKARQQWADAPTRTEADRIARAMVDEYVGGE